MWLKQSTTITMQFGPFLDVSDGATEEVAATLIPKVSKNGGTFATRNSVTAITHDANGWYKVELDTTDTGTLGRLQVYIQDPTTYLPVWQDCMIVPANVWDSLFGADKLQSHTTEFTAGLLSGETISAVSGSVGSVTGHTNQTGDNFARLGAPVGASMSVDVAAVKADTSAVLVDTADMQPKLGTPAADIAADIAAVKAETVLIVADTNELQTDDIPGTIAALNDLSAAQVKTEIDTALVDAGLVLQVTTIATLASQTSFTLTAGSVDNDAYNGCWAIVTDVSTATQKAIGYISAYTGATKAVTLIVDPGVFVMAATDKIAIVSRKFVDLLIPTQTSIDAIETDTADMQPKIGAPAADLAADIATVKVDTAATLVDTADMQPKIGTPAADLATDIAAVKAETALIVVDTNELQSDDIPTLIAALNNISAANVNAEVLDVLVTDVFAQVGQETPAATQSFLKMLQYLYKAWRNKSTQIATEYDLYNDDTITVDHKATVSDDGTTFVREEVAIGP